MASVGDYLGTKLVGIFKKMNTKYVLIILATFIFGFVFWGGISDSIIGGTLGYFGINMIYSPFTILLSEAINNAIESKYRATLLSISNQFDEFFGILIDPVIGVSIDILGFRTLYICLGIISILALAIISLYVKQRRISKND